MWPLKALVKNLRSSWCHSNHVNSNASDAIILIWFRKNALIKFRYTRYVLNARLLFSLCWPETCTKGNKLELDRSLVQDESSLRCWLQSNKLQGNSGYTTVHAFYIVNSKHVTSFVIWKLDKFFSWFFYHISSLAG